MLHCTHVVEQVQSQKLHDALRQLVGQSTIQVHASNQAAHLYFPYNAAFPTALAAFPQTDLFRYP